MSEPKTICGFPVNERGDVTGIPCPFCGTDEATCEPAGRHLSASDPGYGHPLDPYVECPCGGAGPHGATTEEAIEAWLRVPSWRHVKEGEPLPEWVERVLLCTENGSCERFVKLGAYGWRPVYGWKYWMPLPPVPEEKPEKCVDKP